METLHAGVTARTPRDMVEQNMVVVKVDRFCAQNVFSVRYDFGLLNGADTETGSSHHLEVDKMM